MGAGAVLVIAAVVSQGFQNQEVFDYADFFLNPLLLCYAEVIFHL